MKHVSKKERTIIFNKELEALREGEYIHDELYENVKNAHHRYTLGAYSVENNLTASKVAIDEYNPTESPIPPEKEEQSNRLSNNNQIGVVIPKKVKPPKPKKQKSPEQIRDRNITWTLILGVILLLIGGLYVATSNWSIMANEMKMISIALVSVVFFGISWFSFRVLKIEKTAFAFLTLASLFIPIVILSIGYFQLFNEWFSLAGEGKYLFIGIAALICLPMYLVISQKFKSRIFVWISLVTSSISIGFLIASLHLTNDAFYFGIMFYNAVLLVGYHKLYKLQKIQLFLKELPNYAQLNLVISTLLMLIIYENELFYSFNVILTAILYMSMVFVYQTKHYHFVFSALLVYGIYQFIENSFLHQFNVILFALVGFLFIGLQFALQKDEFLKRMFQYTSGIISFFAFIYISLQGILLQMNQPSEFMFMAYLLISLNYLYLAYKTKHRLFSYLTPIFLIVAGFESFEIVNNLINLMYFEMYIFGYAVVIFALCYLFNQWKITLPIKISSLIISMLTMIFAMGLALFHESITQVSLMLLVFGFILFATNKSIQKIYVREIIAVFIPIIWLLSGIFSFDYFINYLKLGWYEAVLGFPFHLSVCSLVLLCISHIWNKLKEQSLSLTTFLISQVAYTAGLFLLLDPNVEKMFVRPALLFVGIGMYILLAKRLKMNGLWVFPSITSLLFLLSLISTINIINSLSLSIYLLIISIILLTVSIWVGKKYEFIHPYFFWTAQLYLPIAIVASLLLFVLQDSNPNTLFLALFVYIYSVITSNEEWRRKLFLYLSFTTLMLLVVCNIIDLDGSSIQLDFALFITSMIIGVLWLLVNSDWRKRIDFYLIPLSMIGILTLVKNANTDLTNVVIGMIYIAFTLFLLHQRRWTLLNFIPLLLSIVLLIQYQYQLSEQIMIIVCVIGFILLKIIGEVCYKSIVAIKGAHQLYIDWYTFISLLYLVMLYPFIGFQDSLWMQLIPALLMVYWIFSQIKRVELRLTKKIMTTLTGISILYPYYILIMNLEIPKLIEIESYVLPWIVLTAILSKLTWKQNHKQMKWIQAVVTLIVAVVLVVDAQLSHTINDAIVVGTLSLISLLGGLHYKIKSYFFIGSGVLLLNLFIQTKPLWGNAPFWVYLLVAGLILIGFASFYERQKKKTDRDGNSMMKGNVKKVKERFKEWE
ncbi:SCO7613 C-terminal domain-containing membrane protein [Chengkuizengella axinellae]|uniref:DUF2157 domain-containing protein n=1 Tax=Chengkuizengella axinellae TaxID=3064388 RepID=A0ABT9IWI5_9BACL|nr:hypothetical protein [Chengkuizengella sp. 2205SS18-9]MDP5273731.1 hypothetical protein [Chengkuizengella sp. 2205SS18-9]